MTGFWIVSPSRINFWICCRELALDISLVSVGSHQCFFLHWRTLKPEHDHGCGHSGKRKASIINTSLIFRQHPGLVRIKFGCDRKFRLTKSLKTCSYISCEKTRSRQLSVVMTFHCVGDLVPVSSFVWGLGVLLFLFSLGLYHAWSSFQRSS